MKDLTKVVYHLENPIRQSWVEAIEVVASELHIPRTDFIPFPDWLDKVHAVPDKLADTVPAKLLYDFFKNDFVHMACGGIVLDTKNTRDASSTLRRSTHVGDELLVSYVHHWRNTGYLT